MMKQVKFRIQLRVLSLLLGMFLSVAAFAQGNAVSGQVKDAAGEPVIGATVRIDGQSGGTITDFDGNFSIEAPAGATLVISYIGYQDVRITAAPDMVVTMQEDAAQALNEVVVIGYGAVKKSDLTGSVTALRPDGKNKGVVVTAQDMLSGKVAGVNVTVSDGTPGGGAQIRVRGGSSLTASNDPLVVIDGIAMNNQGVGGVSNLLASINPQDIESFNILKDASATAIYGSRGSNGVIIITTKKGRRGQKLSVSYSGSATVSMKQKTVDVMNAAQYREFIAGIFGTDSEPYSYLGTADTDWQDLIYRTAVSHDHNVTLSGSVGDNLPYRISAGFTDQQGILKTSDYKRVTASVNLNPSLLDDHLQLNLNAKGMFAKSVYANTEAVRAAVKFDPTQDPYSFTSPFHSGVSSQTLSNLGGYYQWVQGGSALNDASWPNTVIFVATRNPLSLLDSNIWDDKAYNRQFIGSADVDYKVHGFEDLRLHLTLGIDILRSRENKNASPAYADNIYFGNHGTDFELLRNYQLSAYAQYFKDFNEKQHFDIMAGYEYQRYWRKKNNDYISYYPMTNNDATLAGTARPHTPYNFKTEHYLVSFFGRANYTLMNRYMFTATVRDDGSSKFKEHWAWFPSFAFAWKIKDENKFREMGWLSDLKLRLGWGMTGQQDGDIIDDYGWVPTYSRNTGTNGFYPLLGDGTLYRPDNYNDKLKWETTTTYNIGLDWGILDQRLTGSIDWYLRNTTDLLNRAPLAALFGFTNEGVQNIGSLRNTGVEVSLDWKALQTKDWFWTIGYNFTYNKNKITDLSGVSATGDPVAVTDRKVGQGITVQANQTGYAANSFYVYQQVYDKDGKPIEGAVVDRNGDGEINEKDKYLYKSPAAPVTMGLASRLEYRNWDFGLALRASIGNYVYDDVMAGAMNISPSAVWAQSSYIANRPTAVLDYKWQHDEMQSRLSDMHVKNASFLKCDNITLGYSFTNVFKAAGWNGLSGRVYATAANVFTVTSYDGLDPEIGSGIDDKVYPRPRSFILGLSINF